jgi:hypothetical protein
LEKGHHLWYLLDLDRHSRCHKQPIHLWTAN